MKAIKVTLNVVALVFMQVGVIVLGAYLGEVLLGAHGGKFFDLTQQLLIAGMLVVLGGLFPSFARWSFPELALGVVTGEMVILAIVYEYEGPLGWDYFGWVWLVTRFTTLPFAASIAVGYLVAKWKKSKPKNGYQSDEPNAETTPRRLS